MLRSSFFQKTLTSHGTRLGTNLNRRHKLRAQRRTRTACSCVLRFLESGLFVMPQTRKISQSDNSIAPCRNNRLNIPSENLCLVFGHNLFCRSRSRKTCEPPQLRSRGKREDPHSKLLILDEAQRGCLDGLVAHLDNHPSAPKRCGPVEFGCTLKTFFFDIRLFPQFSRLCEELIQTYSCDSRPRRITSSFLSTYSTKKPCSPRDNRAMFAPHRDDGLGDDISLVFGLSPSTEFSGGLLRVSNTLSGSLWRTQNRLNSPAHKRGSVSYDISFGRCCVLQNAEHSVQRLHWGSRRVAIVTGKPIRRPTQVE